VVLGAFISGLPVEGRAFAGGAWDWLTPFSLFCGLALIVAYALLGCTWLMMRTGGELQKRMQTWACRWCGRYSRSPASSACGRR